MHFQAKKNCWSYCHGLCHSQKTAAVNSKSNSQSPSESAGNLILVKIWIIIYSCINIQIEFCIVVIRKWYYRVTLLLLAKIEQIRKDHTSEQKAYMLLIIISPTFSWNPPKNGKIKGTNEKNISDSPQIPWQNSH